MSLSVPKTASPSLFSISAIQMINVPTYGGDEAYLTVYQNGGVVPFETKRVFTINAKEECNRGHHAHKECSQLFVVLHGSCKVTCDDGTVKKEFILDHSSKALLVPPSIWAEQEYEKDTVLMVFTDMFYDENDYIRDYDAFKNFRKR